MRKFIIFISMLFCLCTAIADEYKVENVLEKQEVPKGTIGIDSYGFEKELKYVLVPVEYKEGDYSVELERAGDNLYKIKYSDIYIKTKYCHEYGYSIKAILIVKSRYSYDRYTLVIK